jgi:hypothetical protein
VSRRHAARSRTRGQLVAGLILVSALALVAVYVWRGMRASSSRFVPEEHPVPSVGPRSPSPDTGEEFSEAERHRLEEILKRRGARK